MLINRAARFFPLSSVRLKSMSTGAYESFCLMVLCPSAEEAIEAGVPIFMLFFFNQLEFVDV